MALKEGQFGELKVPLTWTAGVAVVIAGVIGAALVLNDRRETLQNQAYGATRHAVDTVASPVSGVIAAPFRWARQGGAFVGDYFFAVSENRKLKAELTEMRQWRDVALALQETNGRYKALLGLRLDPPIPMVAARVISDSHGPYANTRLADAGASKGIETGNPVMSERGLLGRVLGVAKNISRVMMLTDPASRVPVMIDRNNSRAILTGDGGPNPKLEYLRGADPVKTGDRIVTSGDGGVLPRGLPVGTAVKALDGGWRVALFSDSAPVDYVRILLFKDFSQLEDKTGLTASHLPPVITENPKDSLLGPKPQAQPKPKPPSEAKPQSEAPASAPAAKAPPAAAKPAADTSEGPRR